jgi:predicted extracellular nuclease
MDEPVPPSIDRGTGSVSLTTLGVASTQNFDTLANSGTTNTTLPAGWYITETGGSARDLDDYAADTGSSNTGDTYSYGAASTTERALGALQSGTLISTFGAQFTNNTGGTITSLDIAYTGEQWRIGNTAAARDDRLDFQISTNATNLCGADSGPCAGTYTDVNALDFTNPVKTAASAGALNGNLAANRTALSTTIPSLSIPNGATFWIRWTDLNSSGADDGLAVDDFSLTANGSAPVDNPPTVTSTVPADNATNVPANANVSVTFSEAVTVTTSSFQISCATSGTHAFGLSGGPTTYTLDPTTDFSSGEVCTVTVFAAQVTDQDGTPNQMAADYVFDFTVVNSTPVAIHDIQGSGAASPLAGQTVTTSGVVTLLKTGANTGGGAASGFFLQAPDASADADPNTSEGIFVFTSSVPTVAVGDAINVTGTVVEFNGMTEISPVSSVSVNSTGNGLPTPVTLTTTILDPAAAPTQPQLEKYEGMRLAAPALRTVAPNDSFFDVYTVLSSVPRPVREPGIPASDPVPPDPTTGTPDCCVPIWDENPERLKVDTNGRAGAANAPYTSNVTFTNVTGPLDYAFGEYRLVIEAAPAASANMTAVPVPTPLAGEFTVASYNIENFNNNATQREKAALTVRNVLHYPDIIGLVEIFDLADLQALRDEINNDAVAAGDPNPQYEAYLIEADGTTGDNDQDVAFLVKTSRVSVTSVTQEREEETFVEPGTGNTAILHDRPPLVLDATVDPSGANPRRVIVISNHLRSFIDSELVAGDGPRVREKRKKQAESLADLLDELQDNNAGVPVISVGDYNAYQFSSGLDDSVSVIKGTPRPDEQIVVDQSPDLVDPDYYNLIDNLPVSEQYSFIFEGTPQALDHHIVNTAALSRNTRIAIARVNSDFPENPPATYASNAATPERNSDHDPVVSYYTLAAGQATGSLIVSEFRFRGPNAGLEEVSPVTGGGDTIGGPNAPGTAAENDEFIELYNNTDADITVSALDGSAGWALVAADGQVRFIIPNGTVIPARRHFLAVNTDGYSLSDYAAGDEVLLPDGVTTAGGYNLDIPDESGVALFRTANPASFTAAERLDAAGYASVPELYREGAGLPAGAEVGGELEYSWLRQMCAFVPGVGCFTQGTPKDTGVNAADFISVDTSGVTQSLGAPGPEGLTSPYQRNAEFPVVLLDNQRTASQAPNRVRDLTDTGQNKTFGTMSIRRTVTNNTGGPITYLAFRVVQITTAPQTAGVADLRVLDSDNITVTLSNGTEVDVSGTYVETPPDQPNGGALNTSVGVGFINLDENTVENGESVNVQFLLGVEKTGSFRFYINVEAFDESIPSAAPVWASSLKKLKSLKSQPRSGIKSAPRQRARGRARTR